MWNFYVWPITAFALIGYYSDIKESPTVIFGFLTFMTAVIILHLNAWDKEIGTKKSRIVYAITFITWSFLPIFLSKDTEHIHLELVPLYIAVSNYAFRNWELTKNLSGLGKKSKIIITVFIIISVLISISIPPYISYNMIRTLKSIHTKEQWGFLYKVPVERKIANAGNQIKDNIKINYENFEMKLPGKIIEKGCPHDDDSKYKIKSIRIEKNKLIVISIPNNFLPKDKNGKEPLFEKYNRMLCMTPDKINFLNDYKEKVQLLITKSSQESYVGSGSIYKFETSNIRGFQFVNSELIKKAKAIKVEIFDKNDHQYELQFFGFSQEEIDYVLSSIRFN
ncbi:MAG: hypothetical protein CVU52_05960 [Deltaproteobacteria bacterium HGW-Deltaproteobacteria-10]|nr:MAG: hypothetical protein CVU62_12585 [Deltaproteobacteria bacterium HGW-Deltaproteobacteria-2]PKN75524.1 MAG: hypothetical protein CVU52_05960 [Deltaproteobacteria bacterium HGW-Deltaproteobacteria-10]